MKKVLIVIVLALLGACSGIERSPKPDPFFDTEKMAAVMTDVYLVEGAMTANRKSFVELGLISDVYIYEKHDIDSISFKNNFYYYADRVEEFVEVIDLVEKNLAVIKDSINARQLNSKKDVPQIEPVKVNKVPDSLRSKILSYPDESK